MSKKVSAKQKIIKSKEYQDCYICEIYFGRRRQTLRYCDNCEEAYCEGEHGGWRTFNNKGLCIICQYKLKNKN